MDWTTFSRKRGRKDHTCTAQTKTYPKTFSAFQLNPFLRDYSQTFYQFNSTKPFNIFITEVVQRHDARANDFCRVIKQEVDRLINQKPWKVSCSSDVPKSTNGLGGRFLALKDHGTDKKIWKARVVVFASKDIKKECLVHEISAASQRSMKTPLGISAIIGFRIFWTDVTQAYLQSTETLNCKCLLNLAKNSN